MKKTTLLIFLVGLVMFSGCVEPPPQKYECPDGTLVDDESQCPVEDDNGNGDDGGNGDDEIGCAYDNPECEVNYDCVENECVLKQGCAYGNPVCEGGEYDCIENDCVLKKGCDYDNPACGENYDCVGNECVLKEGCLYGNPVCSSDEICYEAACYPACEVDGDCEDPTYKCNENSYCELRGACTIDEDCGLNEVCVDVSCNKVVNCTSLSAYCEDDYFELRNIVVTDDGGKITIKATITAKTSVKGKFRVHCREIDSHDEMTGTEFTYYGQLLFNNYIYKQDYNAEHCMVEHIANPQIFYLVQE